MKITPFDKIMFKVIGLFAITVLFIWLGLLSVNATKRPADANHTPKIEQRHLELIEVDKCEYVLYDYWRGPQLVHHGDCENCKKD